MGFEFHIEVENQFRIAGVKVSVMFWQYHPVRQEDFQANAPTEKEQRVLLSRDRISLSFYNPPFINWRVFFIVFIETIASNRRGTSHRRTAYRAKHVVGLHSLMS
jgi:hypothetical protein